MIDAILRNTMPPDLGRASPTRLNEGKQIAGVKVGAADADFVCEFIQGTAGGQAHAGPNPPQVRAHVGITLQPKRACDVTAQSQKLPGLLPLNSMSPPGSMPCPARSAESAGCWGSPRRWCWRCTGTVEPDCRLSPGALGGCAWLAVAQGVPRAEEHKLSMPGHSLPALVVRDRAEQIRNLVEGSRTMKIAHLTALMLSLLSAAALAQPYVSASAGAVQSNWDCVGASSCDRTDTAFKVIGGYFFAPSLAGEVGYFDYGKAKASDSGGSAEVASSAWGVGVVVHQDLAADWDVYARLGIARMTTKISLTVAGVGSASDSAAYVMPYGGLGVGYRIRPNVALELSWDTIRNKYDKDGLEVSNSLNTVSVGVSLKF